MALRKVSAVLIGTALVASMAPAGAATSVAIGSTTVRGNRVEVAGTASFAADPITVTDDTTVTKLDPPEAAGPAGVDLVSAAIAPLPDNSGLRFIWQMSSLPPTVPPEGVRYTWGFAIGGNKYQLQAKLTNLASITTSEAPQDHVLQVPEGEFFQLRGACVTGYRGAPVSGCFHLAFLDGEFDYVNSRVIVDVPWRPRDPYGRIVADDFRPGALLVEDAPANMSIAASFQAVISSTAVSQYINGWEQFHTVGPIVSLGVAPAGTDPGTVSYDDEAALTGTSFRGLVRGFGGPNDTVFVRACGLSGCAYTSSTPA